MRPASTSRTSHTAELFAKQCFCGPHLGLARGDVPTDAASAAPLLAQQCTLLLLTQPDRLPEPTTQQPAARTLLDEAAALTDSDGMGAFRATEWRVG